MSSGFHLFSQAIMGRRFAQGELILLLPLLKRNDTRNITGEFSFLTILL